MKKPSTKLTLKFAVRVSFHDPHDVPEPDGPAGKQYEYPTGAGPLRMSTFASVVHEYGFRKSVGGVVASDASESVKGPSSVNRPNADDAPGPPLLQSTTGAELGFAVSAATNMYHIFIVRTTCWFRVVRAHRVGF